MKNLIFIFSSLLLLSCNTNKNIKIVKKDIEQDLKMLQQTSQLKIAELVATQIKEIKKNKQIRSLVAVERLKGIEKKYIATLELLDKNTSNQAYKNIYKNYLKWLDKKAKLFKLGLDTFLEDSIKLNQFLVKLGSESVKEKIKLSISNASEFVIGKFGVTDFGSCGFDKMGLLGNNKFQKIAMGEDINLEALLVFGANTPNKKFKHDTITINHGKIRKEYNRFHISIPTQKLGTQKFAVTLNMKNRETEKDSTLYFTQTFEVIE